MRILNFRTSPFSFSTTIILFTIWKGIFAITNSRRKQLNFLCAIFLQTTWIKINMLYTPQFCNRILLSGVQSSPVCVHFFQFFFHHKFSCRRALFQAHPSSRLLSHSIFLHCLHYFVMAWAGFFWLVSFSTCCTSSHPCYLFLLSVD